MAKKNNPNDTPAMRQYRGFKDQYPDCLLFFRMGDFYELFYKDAETAAAALGITLTQRSAGIPMAGIPYHALEGYLHRLIKAGYRVAICEQMEDPSASKGIVRRDITRLVTPGTLTDEALMDEGAENPLAAVQFIDDDHTLLAYAELSTGSFRVARFADPDTLADELARIGPSELLYVETADNKPPKRVDQLATRLACPVTPRPAWQFRLVESTEALHKQFQVTTLTGFGLDDDDPLIGPAGAIVHYLLETQQAKDGRLPHLTPPTLYSQADHLVIDQASLRSLEIERTLRSGDTAGSLLGTLQSCRTAMGKRLLRHWLCYPLNDLDKITQRQNAVAAIVDDSTLSDQILDTLKPVQDVQRIASRVSLGRPSPRDIVALGQSLLNTTPLLDLLSATASFADLHTRLAEINPTLDALGRLITQACVDSPPPHLREGGLIADNYDPQLDEYRTLQSDSNKVLADYQTKITEESGIGSLKLGYNRVFGYYIEVSHANTAKVPPQFVRKQTLKNAERYITPELKEFEDKILGASHKAIAREQHIFNHLCAETSKQLIELNEYAQIIAELDVLACFARRAVRYRYTRPTIVDKPVLKIDEGRHPVLDEILADSYVPNDIDLAPASSLGLITGPNMAGKSTYIRQAALLTLLAHTGAFIPAASATIGLTDRIFTRIGASDEIHLGQSTFMVEMTETANICHHATARSLVILDEIGRGTSTLDGLSLAWAITEHLAKLKTRTLFATHYHELTQLPEQLTNINNLNVTVREWADQVVFLHRIAPGAADKSYGIHVAKIAGLPTTVITRASDLMNQLEVHTGAQPGNGVAALTNSKTTNKKEDDAQMALFTEFVEHPALTSLRESDLNALSPMDAFDLLRRLKDELEN